VTGGAGSTGWLAGISRLITSALDSAVVRHAAGDGPLEGALEEVVLGASRRYTRAELVDATGLDPDEAGRLWRALGFAEVDDDAVVFNDRDVAAIRLMGSLSDAGVLTPDVREAVARATAQSMSRLAEWQVGMLKRLIESGGEPLTPQQSLQVAGSVLPALEELQSYVWRRHLAATISRLLVASGGTATPEGEEGTEQLVVGFADMVGFTRTTRKRSVAELSELIERFGASTSDVIAAGHGRIIKTVGDEVLFVADAITDGVAIALALQERVRDEHVLPTLRIGLAAGPVLVRYGDVFGEVVNIAARLTSHARPDSVLVDRTVADALEGDERYQVRPLRPLSVRGYRHLHPWVLTRA
jgi:adenylate cyclase